MSRAVTLVVVAAGLGVLAYAGKGGQEMRTSPLQVTVTNTTAKPVPTTIQNVPTVKVSNDGTPLAVSMADARTPYTFSQEGSFDDGSATATVDFTVPDGMRFHATHVSFRGTVPKDEVFQTLFIYDGNSSAEYLAGLPFVDQGVFSGTDNRAFQASEVADFYAPAGVFRAQVARNSYVGTAGCAISVNGYMEPVAG